MASHFTARGSANNPRATPSTVCQKCLGKGHFIYECKNPRPYLSRPSRTKMLEKPELLRARDKPSVDLPDEFKPKEKKVVAGTANAILTAREKEREKARKSRRSASRSSSDSRSQSNSSSDSSSDSDSESVSSSSSHSRSSSSSSSRSSSRSRSHSTRSRERHYDERRVGRYRNGRRSASPPRRSASPVRRRWD